MMKTRFSFLTASVALSAMLGGCASHDSGKAPGGDGRIQKVASFPYQVTGVTVSEEGRIFVNFPRWSADVPVSVAEVMPNGSLTAYPDPAWNSWRNVTKARVSAKDHFVCVQSVIADGRGSLWVLDPAAPGLERIVTGGPKLVKIDLRSNRVTKIYPFDVSAAPQGSYLNDARFSPDGRYAYITDSGKPAIVVLDLASGKARRLLEDHPSTHVEKDIDITVHGQPVRRPDGRQPEFAADGIALAPDGSTLYWQALTGKTLYRAPTGALNDARLSPAQLAAKVERAGINGVADGLLITRAGDMIVTAPVESALKIRPGIGQNLRFYARDDSYSWPDTLAEGPDGSIYFTDSHIPDGPTYKPGAPAAVPTELWRILPMEK